MDSIEIPQTDRTQIDNIHVKRQKSAIVNIIYDTL